MRSTVRDESLQWTDVVYELYRTFSLAMMRPQAARLLSSPATRHTGVEEQAVQRTATA